MSLHDRWLYHRLASTYQVHAVNDSPRSTHCDFHKYKKGFDPGHVRILAWSAIDSRIVRYHCRLGVSLRTERPQPWIHLFRFLAPSLACRPTLCQDRR